MAEDNSADKKAEKNYITPAGFRALQAEFEHLRNHKRREVVVKLAEAAAEGDRSENAEYIYRKKQLREIDRRIRFLMKRMSLAEVIDPTQHRSQKRVCFGAVVSLENEDGKTMRYQIVGVDESEPRQGRISWRSPVGRALIGKAVDDTVSVRWHAGERELTVLGIEFPDKGSTIAPVIMPMEEPDLSAVGPSSAEIAAAAGDDGAGEPKDSDDGDDSDLEARE